MKVVLGVCGGIAAYKAAEIVRALQGNGAEVAAILTPSAERFITALTFNALTGRPVHTGLWHPDQAEQADGPIEHIAVAQWADVLLVAPASATSLARFAHGLADDFLSATYLATRAPVVLAPAMNANMWEHPATQTNLRILSQRGHHLVSPAAGYLACGMTGPGRLAEVEAIVAQTIAAAEPYPPFNPGLAQERVLITAGGTREALDPVRFLGNRSSGRMGHALAEAARARGARVTLITAASLDTPAGCFVERVESAREMQAALQRHLPDSSLLIAAAAVADFRPAAPATEKIRRTGPLLLALEPTPDLVANAVRDRRPGTLVVAFAAETTDLEANARAKLSRKGVDAVVANDVSASGSGFDAASNTGLFLTPDKTIKLPLESKRRMADRILDQVLQLRSQSRGEQGRSTEGLVSPVGA